jgi:ligand-binding sensor domain-containing protein
MTAIGHHSWRRFDTFLEDCRVAAVDSGGCLLCGTSAGLAMFDGRGFVSFGKEHGLLPSQVVCSVAVAPDGPVWVGTDAGSVASWDGDRFKACRRVEGFSSPVAALLPQPDGSVLAGGASGLFTVAYEQSAMLAGADVNCLARDSRGYTWVGTSHGLFRLDGDRLVPLDERHGLRSVPVTALAEDAHANLWIGSGLGITRFDGTKASTFTSEHGIPKARIAAMTVDSRGLVWFGTMFAGAGCFDGHIVTVFTTKNGLPHDNVASIAEDREGSIWLACLRGGMAQLDPTGFAPVVAHPVAEALAPSRWCTAWWGRNRTLVRMDRNSCRDCHSFHGTIRGIMEDAQGRLWVATDSGVFVFPDARNPAASSLKPVPAECGDAFRSPWSVHQDARSSIWVADSSAGLFRYDEQRECLVRPPGAEPFGGCSSLASDGAGRIWLAGWNCSGIGLFDGRGVQRYTTDHGLPDNCTTSVAVARDGTVWAGTAQGLASFNGKSFNACPPKEEFPSPFIQRVVPDARGRLWIATLGGGIARFDGRNFQVLTTEDGLPSNCVTGIIENNDGSIVVSTYRGVCRYVPDYGSSPQVYLDHVEADRLHPPAERVRVPDSVPAIRIRFHGVSLKTRRMRYAYIMEGADSEWKSTWDEEVRYEGLPRGSYTFRVSAINRDLVCSKTAAVVRVDVEEDPRDEKLRKLEKEVRNLEGLLPICSVCKSIRNESGQWERMESYIMRRSKADFSHGYCPECASRLMAEFERMLPASRPETSS